MADLRQIKNRIGSVKNTSQITKAMQMISASKMGKAQTKAIEAIPYANLIYEIVSNFRSITDCKSPYLNQPKEVKNIGIVVIGTSRGFVGSQIASLTAHTQKLINELKEKFPDADFKGISLHKTGLKIVQSAGLKSELHFAEYFENQTTTALTSVFDAIVDKFTNSEYDLVYIVHSHFINTMIQRVVSKQILPISIEELIQDGKDNSQESENPYVFEPDRKGILDKLLPEYFQTQIFTGILESIASEHSARMVAMKSATDNANELQQKLTLKYNRQRQAAITQQLIEVVSNRKKKVIKSLNTI